MRAGGYLAVSILAFTLTATPPAAAADRAIARSCYEQAQSLLQAAAFSEAIRLLESAIEFDPGYSDAWYLLSVIERRDPAGRVCGIEALERAVREDSWDPAGPEDSAEASGVRQTARLELAAELLRTGRLEEAVRHLRLLEPARTPEARVPALLARAFLEQGAWAEAGAAAEEGLKRFPHEPELYRLAARALEARGRAGEARRLLDNAGKLLPKAEALLLERARLEPNGGRRLDLLRQYRELKGADPSAAILALEAKALDPKAAADYLEFFLQHGGDRRLEELIEAARLLRPRAALQDRLRESARGYSGPRWIDRNRDGDWEERYEYREGALQSWVLDRDQDGQPEARAEFLGGPVPTELSLRRGGGEELLLRYGTYPHLDAVSVSAEGRFSCTGGSGGPALPVAGAPAGDGARLEYRLVPFRLPADLLQIETPIVDSFPSRVRFQAPSAEALAAKLDPGALRLHSYRVDEVGSGDGAIRRTTTLLNGLPVSLEEDSDGDGRIDHRVQYRAGAPWSGSRDLEGDGVYEVREEYAGGALVRILWDEDGDGRPEYAEQPGANGSRSWDYDGDGLFDRTETLTPDGSRIQQTYRKPSEGRQQ
jgi:tetratricopeptide (TPR) repeat protein